MSSWIILIGPGLLCSALPVAVLAQSGPLVAGSHNTLTINACTNYNPDKLAFTTPPAGGVPPYTYQWLGGASSAGPWTPIAGATENFYDPPNLVMAGNWCFCCRVTDQSGCSVTTLPKMIMIVPDPAVTVAGAGIFSQNSRAALTGQVTGGAGTISLQWYASLTGISGWVAMPGATSAMLNVPTASTGITYYRLRVDASGAACSKPWSAVVPVIVVADTVRPTFQVPDGPLVFCVENIADAHYEFSEMVFRYLDGFRFRPGDRFFDLDTAGFQDECALKSGFTIRWMIGDTANPEVAGSGQPSLHAAFELPGSPGTITHHTITWWIADCNGNESMPQSRSIAIHPRPPIIMN